MTSPQFEETIILPPALVDLNALPLLTDTQYLEAFTSQSLNRKFCGVVRRGIFRGYACEPGSGLNLGINIGKNASGEPATFGVALVERDDYLLTVRQQHDMSVTLQAGKTSYVVLEAIYQHGLKTTQVDINATQEAACIKVVGEGEVQSHHLVLCKAVIPAGTTQLTMLHLNFDEREQGGYDLEGHVNHPDPHVQYERKDNAATDDDINKTSYDEKHVKLPQFWKGIYKKLDGYNIDTKASQSDAEAGTNDTKWMSPLKVMQWWNKLKTTSLAIAGFWSFRNLKVDSTDNNSPVLYVEGHRSNASDTIGTISFKNRYNNDIYSIFANGKGDLFWHGHKIYHEGNKPSKADVGLSSVVNAGQSSSVTSTSTSTYATTAGVKTAYDKAVSALNTANSKMTQTQGDARYASLTSDQNINGKNTFAEEIGVTEKSSIKYDPTSETIQFKFS